MQSLLFVIGIGLFLSQLGVTQGQTPNAELPLVLDLIFEGFNDVLPCLYPCIAQNGYPAIMSAINGQGPLFECALMSVNQFNTLLAGKNASDAILNLFINNRTSICSLGRTAIDCFTSELEVICGVGMAENVATYLNKWISLMDCQPNFPQLNLVNCLVTPLLNASWNAALLNCVNGTFSSSLTGLADAFLSEPVNLTPLCAFAMNVSYGCGLRTFDEYWTGRGECQTFSTYLRKNIESVLEFANCYANGTGIVPCFAVVASTIENIMAITNGNEGNTYTPVFPLSNSASHVIQCINNSITTYGNTSVVLTQQYEVDMVNIARTFCGKLPTTIECFQGAFQNTGCSQFLAQVLLHLEPAKYYFDRLGGCDVTETPAVDDCRCLADYKVPVELFGTCNGVTKLRETIIVVSVKEEWFDHLSQQTCEDGNYFGVVCQELRKSLRSFTLEFIGAVPSVDNEVELIFQTMASAVQAMTVRSTVQALVMSGEIAGIGVQQLPVIKYRTITGAEVIAVRPQIGPQSGGTSVTVTGFDLDGSEMYIQNKRCLSTQTSSVLIVCSTSPANTSQVGTELPISLRIGNTAKTTDFKFTYRPDPVITKVDPLESILEGGVFLTVSGSGLDSVGRPIMDTTLIAKETNKRALYTTVCRVESASMMLCPTPPIVLSDVLSRRRRDLHEKEDMGIEEKLTRHRRQADRVVTINEGQNVDIIIGFRLDGVDRYENLTGDLEEFRMIKIYAGPQIIEFDEPGLTRTFTSTWPVGERVLEIKGEMMTAGVQADDYTVKIGDALCNKIDLFSNRIICEPPIYRPTVTNEDSGYNRIPVMVLYGESKPLVGYLMYIQTIWEYPPGRYGIIGGIIAVLLIIVFIIACCVARKLSKPEEPPPDYPTATQQLNLVQRVKRWSRKSPKRFSSFIPSGNRQTTNYMGTTSDEDQKQETFINSEAEL